MKKIPVLMAALLLSNGAFAECSNDKNVNDQRYEKSKERVKEKAKNTSCCCPCDEFAWGIGVGGLAVIAVVAGLTASMASGSSH